MNTSRYFYQLIGIALLLFLINDLNAQRVEANRWYLSADGGVSVFFGDVKRYDILPDWESPSEMQPMFSASFGREFTPIFRLRGQFLYGNLSGHKQASHINFKSNIVGGHVLADINLIYLLTRTRFGANRLNVFASLGLGYISWDTKLYYDTPRASGDLMAEKKAGHLSIPGSLTIEYLITQNFSVKAEGMLYVIMSDEVDAKPGGIEVDMINYNSLGITYKFKTKKKAKRTRIKYRLDPVLYEPIVEEIVKEEEAVAEEEVIAQEETVIPIEVVIIPQEIVVVEDVKTEELKETPSKFVIDHELEAKAVAKEKWTPADEDPWPEVEFTVQILAAKNKKDVDELQRLFSVKDRIVERYDGNWYRYSVGSFDMIWRARELRNVLRSRNNISDAFIAVYRNGERISLKETMEAEQEIKRKEQQQKQEQKPVEEQKPPKKEVNNEVYPLIKLTNSVPYTDRMIFGVQILSIKNDHYRLGELKGVYNIDKPILVSHIDPWYQIVVHGFDTYDQASAYKKVLEQKGFTDSFVVAFKNGKKLDLTDLSN